MRELYHTRWIFFYGAENSNFNQAVEFLHWDLGQNLMTNNSLSINVESEGIFYENFNTAENFDNVLLL